MRTKENNVIGITLFLGLIVIGSVLYHLLTQEEKTQLTVVESAEVYSIETEPVEYSPPVEDPMNWDTETVKSLTPEEVETEPSMTSFHDAFAEARKVLGPGQTFYWNGCEYRTNYLEEEIVDEEAAVTEFADSTITNSEEETSDDAFSEVLITD